MLSGVECVRSWRKAAWNTHVSEQKDSVRVVGRAKSFEGFSCNFARYRALGSAQLEHVSRAVEFWDACVAVLSLLCIFVSSTGALCVSSLLTPLLWAGDSQRTPRVARKSSGISSFGEGSSHWRPAAVGTESLQVWVSLQKSDNLAHACTPLNLSRPDSGEQEF